MRPVQIGSIFMLLAAAVVGSGAGCGSKSDGTSSGDGGSSSSSGGIDCLTCPVDAASRCVNGTLCPSTSCDPNAPTSITGTVMDPAGNNPLPYVAVYVPARDMGKLDPLPVGAHCLDCESLFTNTVLASAITKPDGTFEIKGDNVPVGQSIPIVVQTGKWRMLYHMTVNGCQANSYPGTLRLPRNSSEGDLPHIAISTGGADSLECLLTRIGVSDSEFVDGNSMNGHIHIFQGGTTASGNPGPTIDNNTPISPKSLWDSEKDLQQFDVVLLSCEGAETGSTQPANLDNYVKKDGGRVFASHYHYSWFNDPSGPFPSYNLASWQPGTCDSGNINGSVNTAFPKGAGMEQWMEKVGASTMMANGQFEFPIQVARHNATVVKGNTPSTVWIQASPDTTSQNATGQCPVPPALTSAPGMTQYFSWDEPVDPGTEQICGRIVYSDLHVGAASNDYGGAASTTGGVVPTGCKHNQKLSPQEDALEFMLFDLSSCLTPTSTMPAPPMIAQ